MHPAAAAFLSCTARSDPATEAEYLAWHQLDHMPEQYQVPGIVLGQRWISTAACDAERAAAVGEWQSLAHLVAYLMAEPVDETLDGFYALGRRLAEGGRFRSGPRAVHRGLCRVSDRCAAPRIAVDPAVVPFRPHRGVYFVAVERAHPEETAPSPEDDDLPLADLVAIAGVAGAWRLQGLHDTVSGADSDLRLSFTVCYLDDEPVTTARRIGPAVVSGLGAADRLLFAGPLEPLVRWDWERFAPHP